MKLGCSFHPPLSRSTETSHRITSPASLSPVSFSSRCLPYLDTRPIEMEMEGGRFPSPRILEYAQGILSVVAFPPPQRDTGVIHIS